MKFCKTQAEAQEALNSGVAIELGDGKFKLTVSGSYKELIRVTAGAALHLIADGASQPHVEAWGSSQPHVVAKGYTQLSVFGAVVGTASSNVAVLIRGDRAKIDGGHQITFRIDTPEEWCEYYGVDVTDGVALLYKGLDANFKAERNAFDYTPGTIPVAPDWDGGTNECGGGLHFSPSPAMTREFAQNAVKYVACPVALKDIAVHPDGDYPQKVKARGCCAPVYEVDIHGRRI